MLPKRRLRTEPKGELRDVKLGLISDVHGDFRALQLVFSHLRDLGADRVVCAGDLVGYGPHPDQVVSYLAEHAIESVRGNHDRWALARGSGTRDEFGGGMPSEATLDHLNALPSHLLVADGPRVGVVFHGSPRSDMEFVQPHTHSRAALSRDLEDLTADLLILGHTHEPAWYRCDRGMVVNPGSLISLPVVRSSRTFAIVDLESLSVAFHHVRTGAAVEVDPWPESTETTPSSSV
jgi:putative phosphoesterase